MNLHSSKLQKKKLKEVKSWVIYMKEKQKFLIGLNEERIKCIQW